MTKGNLSQKERFVIVGVFALAMVARLIAMAVAFDPHLKFEKYFDLARRLIAGGWLAKEAFAYAPGYVYFMAVFVRLGASPGVICLAQIVLGSATCVFIYLIARRLFDHRVATVAGVMGAIYGPFLTHDIEFLSDSFGTFLYAAAGLALLRAMATPGIGAFVLSGVLIGVRAIQRPNVLLLVPLAVLIMLFRFRREHGLKRVAAWCAVLALVTLIPILPITIQNYAVTKEFIPVTDSGGYVFYCSNNHGAQGLRYNPPALVARHMQRDPKGKETHVDLMDDLLSQQVASLAASRTLTPAESSRFWSREGLKCIRRRGLGQLRLLAKKLFYMFHAYRSHDTFPVLVKDERLGHLVFFGMGILAPFAFAGMIITRRKWRDLLLGYALVLTPVASMMIFYVAARFRLGLGAMLIPFAAAGLLRIADRCRVGRWWKAVAPAIAALLCFAGTHRPDALIVQQTRIHEIHRHVYQGEIARDNGRMLEAIVEFQAGIDLAKYPGEASKCAQILAGIYRRTGDMVRAQQLGQFARGILTPEMIHRLQSLGDDFDANFALGRHFLLVGEYAKAADHLSRAVELAPCHSVARFHLAEALFSGDLACPDRIITELYRALECGLRFSSLACRAHVLIGRSRVSQKQWQSAIRALREALRYSPANGSAHALLANALWEVADRAAARAHAERARELRCERELAPELRD